jgi:hypothetical protein
MTLTMEEERGRSGKMEEEGEHGGAWEPTSRSSCASSGANDRGRQRRKENGRGWRRKKEDAAAPLRR